MWKVTPKIFNIPKITQPGWIRPDGVISFQTLDAAETYAKNRCVKALCCPKPFERGVLVKGTNVLAEVDGNGQEVNLGGLLNKMKGATIFHGHPSVNGQDIPISVQDAINLLYTDVKKVVAINKKGEYSSLSKKPIKGFLTKILPQNLLELAENVSRIGIANVLETDCIKMFTKLFPRDLQKHARVVLKFNPYENSDELKHLQKTIGKGVIDKIMNIGEGKVKDGSMSIVIDDFWQKTAPKVGLIYETNFSNAANRLSNFMH